MTAPLKFFTSLRLTVTLLAACMVLIFVATLDQVHLGIYEVQRRYFRAWIGWTDFGAPGGFRFPLPGGWLLGTLLLVNLLAAHVTRFKFQARKIGMILIHSGIALLLVGELLTGIMTVESQLRFDEGQTSNFVTRPREVELVVIEADGEGKERVVSIPQSRLEKGAVFTEGDLPFSIRIVDHFRNASYHEREGSPSPATRGLGLQTIAIEKARETAPNRRDAPAVYAELVVPDAKENAGIYLLSNAISLPQEALIGNRTFRLSLRERRDYLSFTLTLKDFKHDVYEGTDIPMNFSSTVQLKNSQTGEDREVLIYMNNPLRYDGLTFYQASFDNNNTTSILQVVKNPVWILPYVSCGLVFGGLTLTFLMSLGRSLSRSRSTTAPTKSILAWLVPALCLLWLASVVFRAGRVGDDYHYGELAKVPVLANGRVQPLGSVARNALLVIRGKQELRVEDEDKLAAMPWLLEVIYRPEKADERKLFVVHHHDVLGEIGKSEADGKLFSYAEIQEHREAINTEAARIAAIEQPLWKSYERALMKLHRELDLYENLRLSLALPGDGTYASRLTGFLDAAAKGTAEMEKRKAGEEFDEAAIESMFTLVSPFTTLPKTGYFIPLPPGEDDGEWRRVGESMFIAIDDEAFHPSLSGFATIADGYLEGGESGAAKFNQGVDAMLERLREARPDEVSKAKSEVYFNRIAPFYLCMVLYVLAFLCAVVSWLGWGSALSKAGFRVLLLGFALHTAGLITRMVLEGRPPVTNLYSSAVFVGWGAILLAIFLERIYQRGLGTAVAGVIGFATLIIAHHLSLNGDTLEMMRAVLDSNFWLGTHVIVVTLGYSATFLAGLLAVFFIIGRALGHLGPETARALRGMVYGIICFATLFSFVGTVLGGIWADQSWGRFWGWDPKENGAVLIVLWNAIILHARWGGLVKDRGFMMMAVFGNVVTSWSWFGTNMLGVGLHSYGFLDAAYLWLIGFAVSQLLLIFLGAATGRERAAPA